MNEFLKGDDYLNLNQRIERFDERIEEEEYRNSVSKTSYFKGIDTLSAMKIHVLVSDFQRLSKL